MNERIQKCIRILEEKEGLTEREKTALNILVAEIENLSAKFASLTMVAEFARDEMEKLKNRFEEF